MAGKLLKTEWRESVSNLRTAAIESHDNGEVRSVRGCLDGDQGILPPVWGACVTAHEFEMVGSYPAGVGFGCLRVLADPGEVTQRGNDVTEVK